MDFWNDLSKTVSKAADKTVKSSERLAAVAKLKYRIKTLQARRDDAYRTIGRLRFSERNGERVSEPEYAGLFETVDDLSTKIKEAEAALSDLRSRIPCPVCGTACQKGRAFCPNCGAPLPRQTPKS